MKKTTLQIIAAAAVLTLAAPATAQEADSGSLTRIDYQAELDSINAESTTATVLYVIGPILFVGGGTAGLLLATAIACESSGRSWCFFGGDRPESHAGAIVGGLISAIGLVAFVTAIGLDIDSGSRRAALEARRPEGVELTSVTITPTEGGAALQLGGRF